MRHEMEERQSKASRREEEGNARDGDDVRIDLESGVAVIDPAAGQAREQALEQERAERERKQAAARRKALRRAAALAEGSRPESGSDPADSATNRPAAAVGPRTKADRHR